MRGGAGEDRGPPARGAARRAPANADDALSALTRGGIVTAYVASRARPGTSDIVDYGS